MNHGGRQAPAFCSARRKAALVGLGVVVASPVMAQPGIEGTLGESATIIDELAAHGITLDVSIIADHSTVLEGGRNPRASADRFLAQAGVIIDTDKAVGWPGGTLNINYLGFHGDDGSRDTGDIQVYSNIDGPSFDALYSLWYQQDLIDDQLSIKFGKMDANADFAYVANGANFIHSSPGFSPTILSSPGFSPTILGFPSYPDPATAVNVFWRDKAGPYVGAGLYDGATQDGLNTGTRGPSSFFGAPNATFYIAEAGTRYMIGDEPGRIGVGYWHHSGRFTAFDTGRNKRADGSYLVWDQGIYSNAATLTAVDAFFQYAKTDELISAIDTHVAGGAEFTGLLDGRPKDVSGLMASYVGFSDAPGADFEADYELAVEAFYGIRPKPWLELKPDIQYIINPGGSGLDDALVGTLRARLAF